MNETASTHGIAKQGISYLAVGVGTALLELGLFQAFLSFGLDVVIANVAATLIATATNFSLNRNVTFKSASNPVRSAILYILLFVFNTTVSSAIVSLAISLGAIPFIAKGTMQVCVTAWNFVLYKKLIFK